MKLAVYLKSLLHGDFFWHTLASFLRCGVLMRCLRKVILKLTDFVLSYFRGIQLGRPELVKTWEKFEQKKSVKAEKEKVPDSELESRFRSISQKQEVRIVALCHGSFYLLLSL